MKINGKKFSVTNNLIDKIIFYMSSDPDMICINMISLVFSKLQISCVEKFYLKDKIGSAAQNIYLNFMLLCEENRSLYWLLIICFNNVF